MDWEKELEKELEKNEELRKVFEQHPERKALYIEKLKDAEGAKAGCATINPAYCRTCAFSHGAPPFEDMPEKAHCVMYPEAEGRVKPDAVYFGGEKCIFYEKASNL